MTNLTGKQYEALKLNVDHWYSGLAVLARRYEMLFNNYNINCLLFARKF